MFNEIIGVYNWNRTKYMDILCGKMYCFLLLQQMAHLDIAGVWTVNGKIRFAELSTIDYYMEGELQIVSA
jgi:hypothetical protein